MRATLLLAFVILEQVAFAGRPVELPSRARGLAITFLVSSTVDYADCELITPRRYAGVEFFVAKGSPIYDKLQRDGHYRLVVRSTWRTKFEERRKQREWHDELEAKGVPLEMVSDTLRIYELHQVDVVGPFTQVDKDEEPNQALQTTPMTRSEI